MKNKMLLSKGFKEGKADTCLCLKYKNNKRTFILAYADDFKKGSNLFNQEHIVNKLNLHSRRNRACD